MQTCILLLKNKNHLNDPSPHHLLSRPTCASWQHPAIHCSLHISLFICGLIFNFFSSSNRTTPSNATQPTGVWRPNPKGTFQSAVGGFSESAPKDDGALASPSSHRPGRWDSFSSGVQWNELSVHLSVATLSVCAKRQIWNFMNTHISEIFLCNWLHLWAARIIPGLLMEIRRNM